MSSDLNLHTKYCKLRWLVTLYNLIYSSLSRSNPKWSRQTLLISYTWKKYYNITTIKNNQKIWQRFYSSWTIESNKCDKCNFFLKIYLSLQTVYNTKTCEKWRADNSLLSDTHQTTSFFHSNSSMHHTFCMTFCPVA